MPNYVLNRVTFYGSDADLASLRLFVTSENNDFDFNNIIHMPKSLNVEDGSKREVAVACAKARKQGKTKCDEYVNRPWAAEKPFKEWADLGDVYLSNKELYGYETWYGWCNHNWGTKWNSCDAVWRSDNYVEFETAWNMPEEIFLKLAELFPNLTFEVDFADEDIGINCGRGHFNDDGNSWVDYVDTPEFACDVWETDYEEWKREQGE